MTDLLRIIHKAILFCDRTVCEGHGDYERGPYEEASAAYTELFIPRPLREVRDAHENFIVWIPDIERGEPRLCRRAPMKDRIYVSGGPLALNCTAWDNCPAIPFAFINPKEHPCLSAQSSPPPATPSPSSSTS